KPGRAEIEPFEDVEHLDESYTTRAWWPHRDDIEAAIAPSHGRALDRFVGLEVLRAHEPAAALHLGDDEPRCLAAIEAVVAVVADPLERAREILLHVSFAGRERLAVTSELRPRSRMAAEVVDG